MEETCPPTRREMAKVEITPGIIGPSEGEIKSLTGKGAERGLVPLSPGVKKAIAAVLGITGVAGTGAIIWELTHQKPAIVEPASAAQILPEIVVPSGSSAPEVERLPVEVEEKIPIEEVSVEQTVEFLQDLQNKVDEIYDLRRRRLGIGKPYTVQKGDTLWDIAEKHKISVGKILEINPEIENPNLIFSDQKLRMPEDVIPSQALEEIFDRVGSDLARLQVFIESGEQNSLEARRTSQEIMEYWNTTPGENERVKEPEIIVNPEAENGQWIAEQIRSFLRYLPNSGRVVEKIFIEPREFWPDWPFAAGMYTFKDHGAHIYIFEYPIDPSSKEKEEWTESSLIGVFSHEFGHGASLYSEGYNLGFISPAEVVNLVYQDTAIWDKIYRPRGGEHATFGTEEEEDNAWLAPTFLMEREGIFYKYQKPEIVQAKLEFVNYWFSKQLGETVDFIRIGEELGLR